MSNETEGRLIVISGPSGVGKSTLCDKIRRRAGIRRLVTCTTRAPREGEVSGEDYVFLSREEFQEKVLNGHFLEHAEVFGHFYGTPREVVEEHLSKGDCVLLAIDVQGANQLRKQCGNSKGELCKNLETLFVLPPDEKALAERLKGRGTEDSAELSRRLAVAQQEMKEKDKYDHVVINDDLDRTIEEIVRQLELE